jgi:hypothetical protein
MGEAKSKENAISNPIRTIEQRKGLFENSGEIQKCL